MSASLPLLLQIADSAFPTGAFAYSNGLEALARSGCFPDVKALEGYLGAYLRQAVSFDLAFVDQAHAAADTESFGRICLEWDAYFWNAAVRNASLRQGRTLLELLCALYPGPGSESLRRNAGEKEWPPHFTPALGRGLGALGASREETRSVYLYALVRDQMAAVVRLGLLGPRATQALQAKLLAAAPERVEGSKPWRGAPLVEVGQGGHAFLYSRLFQN